MKNVVTLKPAIAAVLAEGRAHRRRLDLFLKLGNQLALPLGFAVHRVLKSFDQLLQVSDPRLEPSEHGIIEIGRGRRRWLLCGGRCTPDLPDPSDQALALSHAHRLPSRLAGTGRGGYRRRSSAVILRITSAPLSTCSRTRSSFSWR